MEMNAIVLAPVNKAFQTYMFGAYSASYYIYWNHSKYSCFNSSKVEITVMIKNFHAELKQANADRKQKIKNDQDAADQEQKDKLKKKKDEGKANARIMIPHLQALRRESLMRKGHAICST